ncbi:hypothetical protein ACLOJK_006438 [Asimina triloba]
MGGSLNSKLALTSLRPYLVSADGSLMDATRRDREIAPGSAWSSAMDSPFQFVSRPARELLPFGSGRHRHRLICGLFGTRCHSPSARGELLPFGSDRHRRHLFRDLSGARCPSPSERYMAWNGDTAFLVHGMLVVGSSEDTGIIETYSVHVVKAFSQLIPYLESQGDLSNHAAIERLISHLVQLLLKVIAFCALAVNIFSTWKKL